MSIFSKRDRLNWRLGGRIYYNHSIDEVRKCLDLGGNPDAIYKHDYYSRSMISWAATRDRADIVNMLLERGACPDPQDDNRTTPLMRAVSHQNLEIARSLVAAGASVNAADADGNTPLLLAVKLGAGDIVRLLVDYGAAVNVRARDGNTPLHFTAAQGFANLTKFLIDSGADISATNSNMNTPADVAEKEFPGLAAMIRGEAAPAVRQLPADSAWRLVAADEVARVSEKEGIGYRLTEIFNFSARTYTQIASNLESRAESQAVKSFSELDGGALVETAYAELVRRGGHADFTPAEKKKLSVPPGPGAS
jgi:hypothetical protein